MSSNLRSHLAALTSLHADSDAVVKEGMAQWTRQLYGPVIARLGWDAIPEESVGDKLLRPLVIAALAAAEDEALISEAKARVTRFFAEAKAHPLEPELRQTCYSTTVAHGGRPEWELIKARFLASDSAEEQRRCLLSLGNGFWLQ